MFDHLTGLGSWIFALLGTLALMVREARLSRRDEMRLADGEKEDAALFHSLLAPVARREDGQNRRRRLVG